MFKNNMQSAGRPQMAPEVRQNNEECKRGVFKKW